MEKKNKCAGKLQQLTKELKQLKQKEGNVLMALQRTQDVFGYLCEDTMNLIASIFGVFPEEVYSIASFYAQFKLQPKGKHQISVCLGTACFVLGADDVLKEFEKQLEIKEGETTKDGEFSLDTVRCVGCCALAPVVTIDGKTFANVKAGDVKKIIEEVKRG